MDHESVIRKRTDPQLRCFGVYVYMNPELVILKRTDLQPGCFAVYRFPECSECLNTGKGRYIR